MVAPFAVNVAEVSAQIGFADAEMLTIGGGVNMEIKFPNAGPLPTAIVAKTVSVAVFITLTVLELLFATYTLLPSGLKIHQQDNNPLQL